VESADPAREAQDLLAAVVACPEVTRIIGVEVDQVDLDVVSLQVPTRAARRVQ